MNILFHKMRTGKKGQIATMLTVALIIFVIASFLVVNLGKTKVQDNKVRNAARAGVLAGGSAACVLLNQMANFNIILIQNFMGFTLAMQFLLLSWGIEYVKVLIAATKTLAYSNVAQGIKRGIDLVAKVTNLSLTTLTMVLMVQGAEKNSKFVEKMIDEENNNLPKNSRDVARSYAFSNVGVDEPKVSFSKSGAPDLASYLLLETKFDVFMRTLSRTNKADTNYGTSASPSIIEFDWDDSRAGTITNNKVAVEIAPVEKINLLKCTYEYVAGHTGQLNSYLGTGTLSLWNITLQDFITMANYTLPLIQATVILMGVVSLVLDVFAAIEIALAVMFCIACAIPFGQAACPYCAYYTAVAPFTTAAGVIASGVAFGTTDTIWNHSKNILCFVWDKDNSNNLYPLRVKVSRTTSPDNIDYGIYKTKWNPRIQEASGTVMYGSILPPKQNFDLHPSWPGPLTWDASTP